MTKEFIILISIVLLILIIFLLFRKRKTKGIFWVTKANNVFANTKDQTGGIWAGFWMDMISYGRNMPKWLEKIKIGDYLVFSTEKPDAPHIKYTVTNYSLSAIVGQEIDNINYDSLDWAIKDKNKGTVDTVTFAQKYPECDILTLYSANFQAEDKEFKADLMIPLQWNSSHPSCDYMTVCGTAIPPTVYPCCDTPLLKNGQTVYMSKLQF